MCTHWLRCLLVTVLMLATVGCGGGSDGNPAPTVTVNEPSTLAVVAPGDNVSIQYVDSDIGEVALTTLYVDRDGDLGTTADQHVLGADRPDGDGTPQSLVWNTAGYEPGTYHVIAVTDDGTNTPVTAEATGTVTINAPPSVSLTTPEEDSEVRAGTTVSVTYADTDTDDTALTDLFADADGDFATTDDRIAIGLARPEQDGAPQTLDWDTTGVPTGLYSIFAVTDDSVNPSVVANATGRVTVINPGNAVEFLGDGGHVNFAEALIGDRSTFTFEFWIKPQWPLVEDAQNPYRNAIYSESAVPQGVRHSIQLVSEDPTIEGHDLGALTCLYWPAAGSQEVFTQPTVEFAWQHVAVVSDAGTLRIYVNGALHDQGPAQGYLGSEPSLFRLGVSGDRVYGQFVIDELRVSSTARYSSNFTPRLIHEPDADTLSLWHFDESGGATATDATGNVTDGTLSATAVRVPADRYVVSSVFDNFEDDSIDTNLWEISYPFASSEVTESGGTLNLVGRPYVVTADEWVPSVETPVIVDFDWTVASGISHLSVKTRSDGNWFGTYAESVNGIGVAFSSEEDWVWITITKDSVGADAPDAKRGDVTFAIEAGVTYHVRIIDDGAWVSVYVDDMSTPLVQAEIDEVYEVNRVEIYNREIVTSPDRLDNLCIHGWRVVR